jgi:hypothetical protein
MNQLLTSFVIITVPKPATDAMTLAATLPVARQAAVPMGTAGHGWGEMA